MFYFCRPIGQVVKSYLDSIGTVRPQGIGVNFSGSTRGEILESVQPTIDTTDRRNSISSDKGIIKRMASTESEPKIEEQVESSSDKNEDSEKPDKPAAPRKVYKYEDPPILFKEVDVSRV